jgi:peptidase E
MNRREFVRHSTVGSLGLGAIGHPLAALAHDTRPTGHALEPDAPAPASAATRKILIAGGGYGTAFIRYMAELTGKRRPKLLYLPTASADRESGVVSWFQNCAPVDCEPSWQPSFIASTRQSRSWEEVLLSVDGIVCSGGNTLNQQAIWKAQGIDAVLRRAWDQGIVLGGASAGSLCWFEEGTTDSRPKELSVVQCLGFLPGSHSPHYDAEPGRRPLYQRLIGSGQMKPGYACDNDAGLYFENTTVKRVVSTRPAAKAYRVHVVGGKVVEEVMQPESIA